MTLTSFLWMHGHRRVGKSDLFAEYRQGGDTDMCKTRTDRKKNGEMWLDDCGNPIQSHGGNIIKYKNKCVMHYDMYVINSKAIDQSIF